MLCQRLAALKALSNCKIPRMPAPILTSSTVESADKSQKVEPLKNLHFIVLRFIIFASTF